MTMDGMHCYINGIGIISPQKTFDNDEFLSEVITYDQNILSCTTPDFKKYISPVQLRRLSRMLRIGMTAAKICLQDANIQIPDGIITATGYGFLEETEKFLKEMLEREEKQLTPTYFMQGTYNSLAGLIGLSVKCTGYNNTYVSKGFAFENALHDSILHLKENKSSTFLVGSYDEAALVQYIAGKRENHYKEQLIVNTDLFKDRTTGTIMGEGSAFFSLSGSPATSTWCAIQDVRIIYRPESDEKLNDDLMSFLDANHVHPKDIDTYISGVSGDAVRDLMLENLEHTILKETSRVCFKHLCGEYATAVAFGLWLGASILKKQRIPEAVKVTPGHFPSQVNTVLLVNQFMNRNYSLILLKRCHYSVTN